MILVEMLHRSVWTRCANAQERKYLLGDEDPMHLVIVGGSAILQEIEHGKSPFLNLFPCHSRT